MANRHTEDGLCASDVTPEIHERFTRGWRKFMALCGQQREIVQLKQVVSGTCGDLSHRQHDSTQRKANSWPAQGRGPSAFVPQPSRPELRLTHTRNKHRQTSGDELCVPCQNLSIGFLACTGTYGKRADTKREAVLVRFVQCHSSLLLWTLRVALNMPVTKHTCSFCRKFSRSLPPPLSLQLVTLNTPCCPQQTLSDEDPPNLPLTGSRSYF